MWTCVLAVESTVWTIELCFGSSWFDIPLQGLRCLCGISNQDSLHLKSPDEPAYIQGCNIRVLFASFLSTDFLKQESFFTQKEDTLYSDVHEACAGHP